MTGNRTCPQCNTHFNIESGQAKRVYCSDSCKVAAYRLREAERKRLELEEAERKQEARELDALRRSYGYDLQLETVQLLRWIDHRDSILSRKVGEAILRERASAIVSYQELRNVLIKDLIADGEIMYYSSVTVQTVDDGEEIRIGPTLVGWSQFCALAPYAHLQAARQLVRDYVASKKRSGRAAQS